MLGTWDIAAITALCYSLSAALKASPWQGVNKWLPPLCCFVGALMGVGLGWLNAGVINKESFSYNLYQGILAGLSAVGIKEITKLKERINNERNEEGKH